jgi:hypothetical protein
MGLLHALDIIQEDPGPARQKVLRRRVVSGRRMVTISPFSGLRGEAQRRVSCDLRIRSCF